MVDADAIPGCGRKWLPVVGKFPQLAADAGVALFPMAWAQPELYALSTVAQWALHMPAADCNFTLPPTPAAIQPRSVMKQAHKHLILAGLLATLGQVAMAQAPATGSPGPTPAQPGAAQRGNGMERMPQHGADRMQSHIAARLAQLKQQLQITPGQEAAWSAFSASRAPQQANRPDVSEFARLTTPERLDRMRTLRADRTARMERRDDATRTFYAALTSEQKRVFDAVTLRGDGGHRGHHAEAQQPHRS